MSRRAKRSASPLPLHLDIRKVKIASWNKDSTKTASNSTATSSSIGPQQGQEVVSFSPFLPRACSHANINDLILQTAARLAREGKRLTRAPQLLPDGIAFDWISDLTAQGESLKNLLSVQGIRSSDLDQVLARTGLHANRASTLELPKPKPQDISLRSTASAPPASQYLQGDASNPIIIDDDDNGEIEVVGTSTRNPSSTSRSSVIEAAAAATTSSPSSNEITAFSPSSNAPSYRALDAASPIQRDIARPAGPPTQGARLSQGLRTTDASKMEPETAASVTAMDDRASVVTYASSPRPERPEEASQVEGGHQEAAKLSTASLDDDDVPSRASPSRSIRNPMKPSSRQLEKRRAGYGTWQSFATESSDAEMDDVHPSSRESSPDKVFPPQPLGRIPGLGFLPQTYDTSGLVMPEAFASISRSGSRLDNEGSSDERERSPREYATRLKPHRIARQGTGRSVDDIPIDPESPDGPLDRSAVRRKTTQAARVDSESNDDELGTGADVMSEDENSRSRSLERHKCRRVRVVVPRVVSAGRRTTSLGRAQHAHSSRRVPTRSGADIDSDSEQDEREATGQTTHSGHTVVIPKAEFARGRRLLAPRNQDLPYTTILMRGDAHFIDQRRKARVTRWSLPVEDDCRHVEDACLIGDNTVVVGYNKGPCQVSLIPVRVDQRPRRIDLSYKAHSTVIENRSSGTSHPNPGIACLAPVADNAFLSGGHDKTVRHWKLTRNYGEDASRAAFSATSVRVPTQHSQAVQALAFSAWNDSVYSASGDFISTTRLDARAAVEPRRVSGKITQVHVHSQDPRLVALEVGHTGRGTQCFRPRSDVKRHARIRSELTGCAEQIDHMDYQVHFYDTRERGFGRKPWLEFGYRAAPPKPRSNTARSAGAGASASASSTPKLGSRYIRGSTVNSLFARGYPDGAVLVWDYRNGAQKEVLERFHFQRPLEVAHTVLAGADVIAYGGYSATFWSTLDG
ncbi:hypothetical protein C8Q77DRAFT_1087928 [Trametes polyzona]|nr:hypothetical protein C8Q77DRAFT_1087928 [Trametes polyzona]